jgi:Na+-transporting NADH:ubiquinone oxidoreductase subunit C
MYKGKQLFEGDEFVSVTLKKGGASEGNTHEVDAITGGTKTSDGVSAMLKNSIENYLPLLNAKKGAAVVDEVAPEAEETEESNVQNVEENE